MPLARTTVRVAILVALAACLSNAAGADSCEMLYSIQDPGEALVSKTSQLQLCPTHSKEHFVLRSRDAHGSAGERSITLAESDVLRTNVGEALRRLHARAQAPKPEECWHRIRVVGYVSGEFTICPGTGPELQYLAEIARTETRKSPYR